jgi:hypothetical protein
MAFHGMFVTGEEKSGHSASALLCVEVSVFMVGFCLA